MMFNQKSWLFVYVATLITNDCSKGAEILSQKMGGYGPKYGLKQGRLLEQNPCYAWLTGNLCNIWRKYSGTPLWQEFEAGATAEAKFARAIDRIPPLLHNLHGDGHSWRQHNISAEKVFSVNSRIALGSEKLWNFIEGKLAAAVAEGLLK